MTTGEPKRALHPAPARTGIAGTIYGTIVVLATVAAGGKGDLDVGRLAILVVATVVVLWIAHVYAHALADSIETGRRLGRDKLAALGRRELPIVLAAGPPVAALVLGAAGLLRESRAVWLALLLGLLMLSVEGVRYARVERLGRLGTLVVVGVNLGLGLVIVGLKALLVH